MSAASLAPVEGTIVDAVRAFARHELDPIATDRESISGSDYFRITIPRNPAATDLQYAVEWSSDFAPLSWSGTGLVTEQDTPSLLVVRDSVPIAGQPKRYYRTKFMKP